MADVDRALMDHLSAAATIAGVRVFPEFRKVNQVFPALIVTRVSEPTLPLLDGPSDVSEARWQIDCWASTYKRAVTLAREVTIALDGFRGLMGNAPQVQIQSAFKENESDLSQLDGDLSERRRTLDFVMRYEV